MKHQYVGDIGDYGKYALLQYLADDGIQVGVNWYLTENDNTTDGSLRDYLSDDRSDGEKRYNPALFEKLKPIGEKEKSNRSIHDVEKSGIIPNAVFFNEEINRNALSEWHKKSMDKLRKADLIFADPDNGILIPAKENNRAKSEKYAFISELHKYYDRNQDVVYYCHKGRRKNDVWKSTLEAFNNDNERGAKIFVLTFHRGTQRSYVFAIHPDNEEKYARLIKAFLDTDWGKKRVDNKSIPFTFEYTNSKYINL